MADTTGKLAMENTPLAEEIKKMNLSSKKSDEALAGQPKATSLHITINLITAGLGTGVFTLPWSTAGASIVPALLIVALVLALNAWTISILIEAAERHQTFDLGSLLSRLPGKLGEAAQGLCNVVLWFSMFLCLVGYLIVMVDCVESYLATNPMTTPQSHPHRSIFVVLAALCVLPLCFLDQRRLAFTSVIAVAANANIFAFLMTTYAVEEIEGTRPSVCLFGMSQGSVAMMSAMMQVVVIQMCVLPMYKELEDRSPAKFNRIVAVAFGVLLLLCSGFAVAGYATFGSNVSSNVLKNLPGGHWGHTTRLAAVAAVAGVFPIILASMMAPLWNSETMSSLRSSSPNTVQGITTCCVVLAAMLTALMITDLGFLNVVNGAISLGAFVAIVPSLIGLNLLGPRSQLSYWRATMYTLMVVGLFSSALGLVLTDNYVAALKSACMVKW